jgi:hypothetical protein
MCVFSLSCGNGRITSLSFQYFLSVSRMRRLTLPSGIGLESHSENPRQIVSFQNFPSKTDRLDRINSSKFITAQFVVFLQIQMTESLRRRAGESAGQYLWPAVFPV